MRASIFPQAQDKLYIMKGPGIQCSLSGLIGRGSPHGEPQFPPVGLAVPDIFGFCGIAHEEDKNGGHGPPYARMDPCCLETGVHDPPTGRHGLFCHPPIRFFWDNFIVSHAL